MKTVLGLAKGMVVAGAAAIAISAQAATPVDVGTWDGSGCCSYGTRGYFFTAPVDFRIEEVYLPSKGGTGSSLEVIKFNEPVSVWPSVTNNFTSLGYWADVASVNTNIVVHAGETIGVLGWDGGLQFTPYRPQDGSYLTSILGQAVTLERLGFQSLGMAHDVWTESLNPIGVIGINVAAVPEPETYAMFLAGLGLLGTIARRRKQAL